METTKIELKKDEIELFKWFRKYQDVWEHAFKKCKPGSITLHFDNQNNLRKWDVHNYHNKPLEPLDKNSKV